MVDTGLIVLNDYIMYSALVYTLLGLSFFQEFLMAVAVTGQIRTTQSKTTYCL